ncbi:MAG: AI-2E family transporter [Actinomycetes bacterium]
MVPTSHEHVPVRTIATTIGMVLLTALTLLFIRAITPVIVWTVIAAFFAVAFAPAVDRAERWMGGRRALATLLVFLSALVVLAGVVALFVLPLAREGTRLVGQVPTLYQQARTGRGPLGHLVARYHIDDYLQRNQGHIRDVLSGLGTPAVHVVQTAATTVAGVLTIFVLAYLMVLQGPQIVGGTLRLLPEQHRERVRRVGADCARSVTGYLTGNLLISVIAGGLTFAVLQLLGVPYAGLLALFVAITDLIPLVGATLGAVVVTTVAFFESVTAGVIVVVFFVVYQQVENHLLQPVILSRTVQLNPLLVLLAVLVGADLVGILGALLAIPVAGIVQIIVRDIYDDRWGRLKSEPTVGVDEHPIETPRDLPTGALPEES